MTEDEFWDLIDRTNDGEAGQIEANLGNQLESLSNEDLADFHEYFQDALGNAYSNDVWGAGYLVEGGMSDDSFEYFRTWLIMQGLETYVSVVADPDSLADVAAPFGYQLEGPQYLSREMYEARTGSQPPRPGSKFGDLGPDWDFDDAAEMAKRYPRLSAKVLKSRPLPPGLGFEVGNQQDSVTAATSSGAPTTGAAATTPSNTTTSSSNSKRPWWKFWG